MARAGPQLLHQLGVDLRALRTLVTSRFLETYTFGRVSDVHRGGTGGMQGQVLRGRGLGSGMPISVGRRRSPRPASKGTPEGARVAEAEPPGDLVYAELALTEVEIGEPAAHLIQDCL